MCRRYRVTDRWSDPCHFSSCRSLHKKPCWHGFFHMDFSYEKWTKSPLFTLPRSDTSWTRGLSLVSLVGVHTVLRKNGFLHPHTSWRVKVRFLCEKKASFKRLSTPPCNHESVNTSGRRKPTWVEMYETLTTVTTVDASECCVATLQRFSERGTTQGSGSVREALGPSHSRPTRRHQYVKCWRRGKWQNRQSKNQQTFRPSPRKPIPLFATSWLQYWWQY